MNNFKKLLKNLFKKEPRIVIGAILILVGTIIAVMPGVTLTTICICLGITSLTKGLIALPKAKETGKFKDIASSIIFISAAIILFIHPRLLLSFIPFIIGICLLIYGGISLIIGKPSITGKIISIASIIMGAIVVITPFALAKAVTAIIGITFIVIGIMIIVSKKHIKLEISSHPDDGYTEVDFTDVDD